MIWNLISVERYEDPKHRLHTTQVSRNRRWVDCLRCGFVGDSRFVSGYRCSVVWSGRIGDDKVAMLSRSTQYAVAALRYLATQPVVKLTTAEEIAAETRIPPPICRSFLSDLQI